MKNNFGYQSTPANGLGIIRARTLLGNLRLWDFPRSERALDLILSEIGDSQIPGLYLLFAGKHEKKVYIGQTENLKNRLLSHIRSPDEKIQNWERAIIINDARNATQSDFNDENIRLALENFLVRLFKINRYKVTTASSRIPGLSSNQMILVNAFKEEIIILLTSKNKISKIITEKGDDEVYNDEVRKILEYKGFKISKWGKYEAEINNEKVFIRPGSDKPKGWQITFRGNKPGKSSMRVLETGLGYLLVPRGPILLIPLNEIKNIILSGDASSFDRDSIDIFIKFEEDKIFLVYKQVSQDITNFAILPFPSK